MRKRKRYANWRDWPQEPKVSVEDLPAKTAAGLSTPQWLALTDEERAGYRRDITSGPNFASLNK